MSKEALQPLTDDIFNCWWYDSNGWWHPPSHSRHPVLSHVRLIVTSWQLLTKAEQPEYSSPWFTGSSASRDSSLLLIILINRYLFYFLLVHEDELRLIETLTLFVLFSYGWDRNWKHHMMHERYHELWTYQNCYQSLTTDVVPPSMLKL